MAGYADLGVRRVGRDKDGMAGLAKVGLSRKGIGEWERNQGRVAQVDSDAVGPSVGGLGGRMGTIL